MKTEIKISGKKIVVSLSDTAIRALSKRETTLVAEMELYFSCLIRKQVRFKEDLAGDYVKVTEQLAVRFRPVMTETCGVDFKGDAPPLTDFPIKKPESFVPHWLRIDYKNHEWKGEFGF